MPRNLSLALVQSRIVWESPAENFKHLNKHLSRLERGGTDVVVLPEMFSTGFSMEAKRLSEEMEGPSMQWMFETSQGLKAAVCGSLMIRTGKNYFNRFIWMDPSGNYEYYDKRHLFSMGGEEKVYTAGNDSIVIEHKGWGVCLMVCYDLRFPVWSRNRMEGNGAKAKYDFDVLLYVANWPAVRSFAWKQLMIARAIENQCFVAGVNRVGKDGRDVEHSGDSALIDPLGQYVAQIKPNKEGLLQVELEWKLLQELRKGFPVLRDADTYRLSL